MSIASILTFTTGSKIVTATGTADLRTQVYAGQFIWFDADRILVEIDTVDSSTQLTLVDPYIGAGGTGTASAVRRFVSGTVAQVSDVTRDMNGRAKGVIVSGAEFVESG